MKAVWYCRYCGRLLTSLKYAVHALLLPHLIAMSTSSSLTYTRISNKRAKLYDSARGDGLLNYIILDAPGPHNPEARERTGHKLIQSGTSSLTID